MAFTSIPTVSTGDIATAAWANTYLKNNFAETAPGLVGADGELVVATAANALKKLTAFSGDLLLHELGAWELNISALTTNDTVGGASAGVAEIKTPVTQAEAEAGSNTRFSLWSSLRVKQAIAALAAGPDISCLVYNSGTQSCANTALVQLTFDTDVYNTDTNHSTANRLTATTAGKYVIVGQIGWAANGTGYRLMRIYKEGTDIIAEQYFPSASASANHYMNVSAQIYLDATEFVILQVEQGSGGSLDVLASTSAHFRGCSFGFMKVLG
jgi:hypothetical protein